MADIAVLFLIDRRGHVLLQHRDEHAPRAAEQWGMVGGHVEPGERFDVAVRRELLEETGVSLDVGPGPGELALWCSDDFTYSDGLHNHYEIYAAAVDLTDDDIVLGEGQAIVFVDPADAGDLDLAESTAHFQPRFLTSDHYHRLVERTHP